MALLLHNTAGQIDMFVATHSINLKLTGLLIVVQCTNVWYNFDYK